VTVLASDGHTRGHIAFHLADCGILLCGDTLFSLGCGRLLEGTAEEMFASLQALPACRPRRWSAAGTNTPRATPASP
jgi:hydroxyacylglutathione hydrolase